MRPMELLRRCLLLQVEGLLEDVDFRLKVTREEVDAMCSDLYDRVQEPVRQALQAADMTMVADPSLSSPSVESLSLCRLLPYCFGCVRCRWRWTVSY